MRPVILLLICIIVPLVTAGSFKPMIRKFKAKEGNTRAIRDSNYSNHIHNHNNTHVTLSDELKALIDHEIVRQARLRLYPFINITSFSDTILSSLISSNSAVNYAFTDTNTSPLGSSATLGDEYDEVFDGTNTDNRNSHNQGQDQRSPLHLTITHSTIVPPRVWGEGSESKFGPIAEYVVQRIQSYFSVYKYDDLSRPAELSELSTTEKVQGQEDSGASSNAEAKQAENSVTESTTTKRTRKPRPTFGARRTTSSRTTVSRITTSKVTRTFKPRNTKPSRPSFFTKTSTVAPSTTTPKAENNVENDVILCLKDN